MGNKISNLFTFISIGFICFSAISAKASHEDDVRAYKKRKKCNYAVMANLNQFLWIYRHWMEPGGTKWNISDNFKKLQNHNEVRYQQIGKNVQSSFELPTEINALKEHLRRLDGEQTKSSGLITDIRTMNYRFEFFLNDLESATISLQIETNNLLKKCEAYKEPLSKAVDVTKMWQEDIVLYRKFIEKQQIRLENLYLISLEVARTHAFSRYIDKTNEKLDSVRVQLEGALELDRRYGLYLDWWHGLNSRGLVGYGLHNKYLQFRKPMQVMKSQLVEARDHYQNIGSLEDNSTKKRILGEIAVAIELLETEVKNLEDSGWSGQFERQKFLNSHRAAKVAPNNPKCQRALELYALNTENITNEHEFLRAEYYYFEVVVGCSSTPK